MMMISRNSISLSGLTVSAMVTPLVPPLLICAGIFSYSTVGGLLGGDNVELRRVFDVTLFVMLLVMTYGVIISYLCAVVFFIPMHFALWLAGIGGYAPYAAIGALSSGLVTFFGLADPAMRNGYLELFFVLCGAIAGAFFWKLATIVRPLSEAAFARPNPIKTLMTTTTRRALHLRP
jgi:hypothetical protein